MISINIWAQQTPSTFDVNIQVRPRAEFRNGQGTLISKNQNPTFFVNNRSRIKAKYSSQKIDIGVAGQSFSVWGQQPQSETYGGFMLNEAWVNLKPTANLSFKIGRQELSYDNDRILGSLDWHASGRFHDLILSKYEKNNFKAHLGLAYNANNETQIQSYYYSKGQPYQHMQMLWLAYQIAEPLSVTGLFMNTGFQSGIDTIKSTWSTSNLITTGANVFYNKNKLKLHGLYYAQLGQNIGKQNVNAFMASISGNYKIHTKNTINLGFDFVSGNNMDKANTIQHAFSPLYGTNHGFYGSMDYFYVGNHAGNVGLIDVYGGTNHSFTNKLSMQLNIHNFQSDGNIIDISSNKISKQLGTEVDLSYKYIFMPGVSLIGGYSQMFAAKGMEIAKKVTTPQTIQNWAWLSLNVDINVFSHQIKDLKPNN
ncbi:MAG: alginate export family protein [Bacteroidia bacterium]|nr:alginate export family protein [Bacteroidia bacterium]MBP9689378.1 alginate export family protein [Bacteroidia bacterium]